MLTAKEASWIQVRVLSTNELILSRVLLKGHSYEVPGRMGLGLMTGNAGALDVSVDGDAVPSLGKLGQTRQKIVLNADRLRDGTAVVQ
jgi:cytoskeleton protein RodZ